MRNNYFIKLLKYAKNVYHIEKQTEHITDKRINPTYKTSQIIELVLIGFLLRINSFNQLSSMIKVGEFKNIFTPGARVPRIDAIRNLLKSVSLEGLRKMNGNIVKKAIRNKVLEEGKIDGYTVTAIDGTKLFNNSKPHFSDCLLTGNTGKKRYSHSCTVMSLVGEGINLVIDHETYKYKNEANDTGEGELKTSLRLLNRAVYAHKGLIDVVAYDALACNAPFVNQCRQLDIEAVIRVKKSHMLAIKKVKKDTNKKSSIKKWQDKNQTIKAYESMFYMDGVEQSLRYIKFEKKNKGGDRSQVLIVTTSMTITTKTIYKIMKARWNIENRIFNNLKNNAGLSHCFVHGGNAVEAVLNLIFIASNIFQLFKQKRLRNHIPIQRELVRLLLKGLYLLKYKENIIFNTS